MGLCRVISQSVCRWSVPMQQNVKIWIIRDSVRFFSYARVMVVCLKKKTGKNPNDLSVFGMHSAQTCHALTCIHTLNYTRNANNSMYFLVVTISPFCLYLFSFYALPWSKKEYQNRLKEIFNGIYGKKINKCKEKTQKMQRKMWLRF